jgi:chromosome segregation ATPase
MNDEPTSQKKGSEFTPEQRAGLDTRRADQDRTLDAIHRLEHALAAAAPRREEAWRDDVVAALDTLEQATTEEERNAALPESLLSDIARTQPRLRNRVRGLRAQYRQLRDSIAAIRRELQEPEAHLDVADLRQRLAWLLGVLRHQRARESDLIYEAYYEAFHRDLLDDAQGPP